ncbi:diaminopimelate epimerase [Guyparkeria hydrothermalis]|nr:diaminopimelate epimerase [Guyparkeria hydrothermalis]MCL7744328.1 diaminopimelate epimerase [Guyparkeria hydrothermalis]
MAFTKMQGLGNDFMVIDAVSQKFPVAKWLTPERIRRWADRHFGIGFDQLLLIEPPARRQSDFRYRIFNGDGSEVEQCGNGARCFARFVAERGLTDRREIRVQTAGGPIVLHLTDDGQVCVDMGRPRFTPEEIPFKPPVTATGSPYTLMLSGRPGGLDKVTLEAVSMGNPHAVIQVDDVDAFPVEAVGPVVESHPAFPRRVNVGFVEQQADDHIRLRVYERGAGETLACGTGACAAVAAGIRADRLQTPCRVDLPGGTLVIDWSGRESDTLFMTGPAEFVFDGEVVVESTD